MCFSEVRCVGCVGEVGCLVFVVDFVQVCQWGFGLWIELGVVDFLCLVVLFQFVQVFVDEFGQGFFVFGNIDVDQVVGNGEGWYFVFVVVGYVGQQVDQFWIVLGDGLDLVVVQGGESEGCVVVGDDFGVGEFFVQYVFVDCVFVYVDLLFVEDFW